MIVIVFLDVKFKFFSKVFYVSLKKFLAIFIFCQIVF